MKMNKNKFRRIVISHYQNAEIEIKKEKNATGKYYYAGIMDVCDGILRELENE